MTDLMLNTVLSIGLNQDVVTATEAAQAIKLVFISFSIFFSLVILTILSIRWYIRSREYDSLSRARELLILHGLDLNNEQMNQVGDALMISSHRNSMRGNNVCQSLAEGFYHMAQLFYGKVTRELQDRDLEMIIKHIHYWEWSNGKGKGIKLILPER